MSDLTHIFDTHSHYDDPRFGEHPEELISSLFEQGLSGIIHASTDFSSTEFGLRMSQRFERYYTSVGIHPEYAADFDPDAVIPELRRLAQSSEKVVAIGEIGLDYHYEGYDRERQTALFKAQVGLANELDLPVIVHSRDATGDCMEILREFQPRGVMHCFSGSWETAKEVLSLGMYLSFTGVLTFKNSKKAREVVEKMPPERILTETDCPYMAPEPHRGELCHSGYIEFTAKKAAELMNLEYGEFLLIAERNAKKLFGI